MRASLLFENAKVDVAARSSSDAPVPYPAEANYLELRQSMKAVKSRFR
jgi:hypothetical protein